MSDTEEEKPVNVKEFIRQLHTLSLEERELISEALKPSVRPKERNDDKPPLGAVGGKSSPGGSGDGSGNMSSQHLIHSPKLGLFSGDNGKGEISFEQWKYEVLSLQREGLAEATIQQCIRRSIRGTAAAAVHNLGELSSVADIVDKLDQIFGNVLPPENILETFYSARQLKTETVASWACRLEGIMAQIRKKERLSREDEDSRLKSKFFAGLNKPSVKTAVRHKYDQGASYKELLVAARVAELEDTTAVHAQQSVPNAEAKKFDDLMAAVEKLTKRFDRLEQQQQQSKENKNAQSKKGNQHSQFQQQQHFPPQQPSSQPLSGQQQQWRTFNGTCYNCGAFGHRRYECPGNFYQPASGDRH